MVIERPGKPDVTVHKAMITPLRERWTFESDDLGEVTIQGSLLDHEYTFQGQGGTIAEVSKRWLRVRDTYGVEVQPGADPVVILAATVALEQMST
ncbi:MAG TPA: LURP-one-related family protein [Dermatophilaceae bacterium]|nr:LURP-one-related family protein [Dermatophilaceae bacterium]